MIGLVEYLKKYYFFFPWSRGFLEKGVPNFCKIGPVDSEYRNEMNSI